MGVNGYELTATDREIVAEIFALAGGRISEAALSAWIREHTSKLR